MGNLHSGHSIDDSYQVLVVAMFANQSGQNEQSPQAILVSDRPNFLNLL
jgi:hypothetical protein